MIFSVFHSLVSLTLAFWNTEDADYFARWLDRHIFPVKDFQLLQYFFRPAKGKNVSIDFLKFFVVFFGSVTLQQQRLD